MRKRLPSNSDNVFSRFRHSLADADALPQLTLLGIITGLACGLLIVLFRLALEQPLLFFLPDHHENFEALPPWLRLLLPLGGALLIGCCLHFIHEKYHRVSVGHVLERLHNNEGRMPLGNGVVQFFAAVISLISGQSVGREGPAVHLGATTGSQLGQWLRLPNNSLGILLGCGVAAAISASFNTPVAAVIFTMEVVLMRYSINGFIPIMMASVCGSLVSQALLGKETFFKVHSVPINLGELPWLLVVGIAIALSATLYIRLQLRLNRFANSPVIPRLLVAGLLTGLLALAFPEVMGLGYDTIEKAIAGDLAFHLLLGIALAKIFATAVSVGLGMPAGVIGPQLVIGACLGGLMGVAGSMFNGADIAHGENYVLIGMTAMMAAVINAPLAALTAMVELTYNPAMIFPSMLVIVVACVITRQLTGTEGIFMAQLQQQGTSLNTGAISQVLGSIGARSVMNTGFRTCTPILGRSDAKQLLDKNPIWLVVVQEGRNNNVLMRASELAIHLADETTAGGNTAIDLLEIPAQRCDLIAVDELASLLSAKKLLDQHPDSALLVVPQITANPGEKTPTPKILGIITTDMVMNAYR